MSPNVTISHVSPSTTYSGSMLSSVLTSSSATPGGVDFKQ
jgi:hypothetical protein